MALALTALNAAPFKTSKAVAMTTKEMQSVKGQGYFYVWVWQQTSYYNPTANTGVNSDGTTYIAGGAQVAGAPGYVIGAGSGPCSFDGYIYIGGPLSGQQKTH
ncbi:MAG TPA: hypothetical protein VGM64_09495 [Lacunisphaera sp.]